MNVHRGAVSLLLAFGCACSAVVAPDGRMSTAAEERAVYALVVARVHESDSTWSIAVDTVGLRFGADTLVGWKERLFERRRAALRAFLTSVTGAAYSIEPGHVPSSPMRDSTTAGRGRVVVVAVSKVVVSRSGQSALVAYKVACGEYCGWDAELWLIIDANGQWHVDLEYISRMN